MKRERRPRPYRVAPGMLALCLLAATLMSPLAHVAHADAEPAPATRAPATDRPTPVAAPPANGDRAVAEWYALGGWVMHLLVLCSALVLGVVAERLWALRPSATVPGRLERDLLACALRGDRAACLAHCASRRSALARVTAAMIEGHAIGADESRERFAMVGGAEVRRLHGNLDTLAGLANIATMLGLLGTVLGMISAFGTIAEVGTSDARVVASGIFEALVTTAGGLVIGVTALACHTHLVRRAERITTRIEGVAATLQGVANPDAEHPGAADEARPTRLVTQAG